MNNKSLCFIIVLACLFVSCAASAQTQFYWYVAGDTANVWSLNVDNFVPATDPTFVSWKATPGNSPSVIGSTSELYTVIEDSYPTHLAASAPNLEASGGLTAQQSYDWRIDKGLTITYTGQPTLSGVYALDDHRTQGLVGLFTGALVRCQPTPLVSCAGPFPHGTGTYPYPDKANHPHTMSIVQLKAIGLAIEDYRADLDAQLVNSLSGTAPVWPPQTVTVP